MFPCPRPSNQLLGHKYNNHMQILMVSSQHREYLCHMFQGNAVSRVSSQNWMIVFIERQNHQLHSHKLQVLVSISCIPELQENTSKEQPLGSQSK